MKSSTTHVFNWIVFRVKFGLTSYEKIHPVLLNRSKNQPSTFVYYFLFVKKNFVFIFRNSCPAKTWPTGSFAMALHVWEELFVAYYWSLVDKFSTCTSLIIVIVEENAQQLHPFLCMFLLTKLYVRRGIINAYLQIFLLDFSPKWHVLGIFIM